jgi:hypothetical protein
MIFSNCHLMVDFYFVTKAVIGDVQNINIEEKQ